jgi:hypothetical protein
LKELFAKVGRFFVGFVHGKDWFMLDKVEEMKRESE